MIDNSGVQIAGIKEGDYLVKIREKDVKWDTKEEVLTKIKNTVNNLRITIVTPIKDSQKYKNYKSNDDCSLSTMSSSSSVRNLFHSSSSRTSFSSISSSSSSSGSENFVEIRKKSPWSVLRISDHL